MSSNTKFVKYASTTSARSSAPSRKKFASRDVAESLLTVLSMAKSIDEFAVLPFGNYSYSISCKFVQIYSTVHMQETAKSSNSIKNELNFRIQI